MVASFCKKLLAASRMQLLIKSCFDGKMFALRRPDLASARLDEPRHLAKTRFKGLGFRVCLMHPKSSLGEC